MGEIADDCFDRAMDELEEMEMDPDSPLWDYQYRHPPMPAKVCVHRYAIGRCPNEFCEGNPHKRIPF